MKTREASSSCARTSQTKGPGPFCASHVAQIARIVGAGGEGGVTRVEGDARDGGGGGVGVGGRGGVGRGDGVGAGGGIGDGDRVGDGHGVGDGDGVGRGDGVSDGDGVGRGDGVGVGRDLGDGRRCRAGFGRGHRCLAILATVPAAVLDPRVLGPAIIEGRVEGEPRGDGAGAEGQKEDHESLHAPDKSSGRARTESLGILVIRASATVAPEPRKRVNP